MDCVAVRSSGEPCRGRRKENERKNQEEEYKMLVGESCDSEKARDEWIDAVEKALEFEAFEDGEIHMERGLDRVSEEGYYPLTDVPRWMLD